MKLIIMTPGPNGLDLRGPGYRSVERDGMRAEASQTQWGVDVYSTSRTEDANRQDVPIVMGADYRMFRDRSNDRAFDSVASVVAYINEKGRGDRGALLESKGGYEFTGGFTFRSQGNAGSQDFGDFVAYTQDMATANQWLRFGFDAAAQSDRDNAYWSDPAPLELDANFDQTKGLFGGSHMPAGVEQLFDFSFNEVTVGQDKGYSSAVTDGDLQYTAATGSFDFTSCKVGDLALVRFDFQVIPQTANTTIEVAMIWQTRDVDGNETFIFPLTGTPVFYGTGTVGKTFLNRPILSAYFASNEDVNARALLAIRADNPIQVAPLTTLCTIQR